MKEQSRRLGTENIPKLIWSLSLPAFMGMFFSMLFNVVDTIFIARGVGTLGVAAMTIAFPIQAMMAVVGATFGVGGASIISRRLGDGRVEAANKVLGHVVWLIVFTSVIFTAAGLVFLKPLLGAFGATEAIMPYATDYLSIVLLGTIMQAFSAGTNNVVRAEGSARIAMYTMVLGALVNVVLNSIFIFGFEWGMKGVALATFMAQMITTAWILHYFYSDKSSLRMKWVGWKPEWRMIREIILIGLPAMATMSATSLTMLGINWALVLYGGEIQIAIFGIINRFIFFVVMPINGIVQGMQPIIGFNYGAARTDRVIRTFWWCTSAATGAAILAWIAVMLVPGFFMRIFSANPEVVQNGSEALRWIFMMTPLTGLPIVAGGLYQAMGIADRAFLLTTARSVLFLIPLVFILPSYLELKGVWISFAMSDALAFLLSVFILLKDWKRLF